MEPPSGAFERSWSAPDAYLNGESVFFLLGNRNVESVVVDLKDPEWLEVVLRLLDEADVLIESFRPGVMDRLGLGWERLRERNSRLVYCSLSGYGSDGPYKDRPGQDVLLQSMAGIASVTGTADRPPTPVGASLVDQHGAVLGAFGILAALHGRDRTGQGTRVESNLLSAAMDLQIEPLSYFLNGFDGIRSATGISSPYYKSPYGVFATADGYLTLSLNALEKLAELFEDNWFRSIGEQSSYARREEINERVAVHLGKRSTEEWTTLLAAAQMWFAPVNGYAEVVDDPQVNHNGSVIEIQHPRAGAVKLLAHPITYDGQRPGVRSTPPELGGSNRKVLAELGYSTEHIDRLQAKVQK